MMHYDSSSVVKPTSFDEIEPDKENILPLKEGRSAQALTQTLREDASQLNATRLTYERRLLEELEDMDDPFELFMEYINWINHAYPQGGNSKQSGMLDVLERCLMYFRDIETYKNDPRLLKLWLWYIELFAPASAQESKDILVYMLRKRIGHKLSLFYESFATLLFGMGKYREAHHIMKMGVNENARPLNRLLKSLEEFETRLRSMNIDINNDARFDPHFLELPSSAMVLGRERSLVLSSAQRSPAGNPITLSSENQRSRLNKHNIFRDIDTESTSDELRNEGWDILDSRANRSKENHINSSKLIDGSHLGKIQQETGICYPKRENVPDKLPIFKDNLGRSDPVYKILHIPGKKTEKIDCNFDLIYPNTSEEFCIEEILALSRNLYYKNEEPTNSASYDNDMPVRKKRKTLAPLTERKTEEPSPPFIGVTDSRGIGNEVREPARKEGLIPMSGLPSNINLDEEISRNQKVLEPPRSPTITFFSKNAMNEVYSMFNQHYNAPKPSGEGDETASKFALYDNFTQEFTRQNIEDLTEVKQADAADNAKPENIQSQTESNKSIQLGNDSLSNQTSIQTYKSNFQEFMTPIQETSEKTYGTPTGSQQNDGSVKSYSAASSPFLTQPHQDLKDEVKREPIIIEDPLNSHFRGQLLANIKPPLDDYDTFYRYNQSLKMSALLKKIHRVSRSENKNPIVDFKKTGDLYCIRTELGEGGYATVYLAESSTGHLRALKVEKPASVWEYYILKQIEKRLEPGRVLRSIINASSLHCFQDESYLVLNYASQGTVLDLINLQREKSRGPLDELLCMFITIELMKVVEAIHNVGIIHGDLKPDNCMIRFESGNLGPFCPDGARGWCNKGIYLIDFGRSFDMRLFQPGTKFKANWKTDQQDCQEMRNDKPWSYEADYFGLAGIIHALLFGEIIETVESSNGHCSLKHPFKRYWRQEIWAPIFDTLLNNDKFDEFPITSKITEGRSRIESFLVDNAGEKLKSIISDLESELAHMRK